jgi:hypothetical protein
MLIAVGSNPTGRKLVYNLYFYIINPLYNYIINPLYIIPMCPVLQGSLVRVSEGGT